MLIHETHALIHTHYQHTTHALQTHTHTHINTHIYIHTHYQHTTHTDTDVAPLWDPSKRVFVAMMTISDYVQALQVCRKQGVSMLDLSTRTITGEK